MSTADRINQRMRLLGIKQVDIVRATGASKGSVSQWINGGMAPGTRFALKLADYLQCEYNWLMFGQGNPPEHQTNVERCTELQSRIPVIGFATAGEFKNTQELKEYEVEEFVDSTLKQNGYRFALRIRGTSMENPNDPKHIPDGSIVIFNAAKIEPESGQLVLAKLNDSDETTFKKFVRDGEKALLEPLNPRYDIITKDFHVVAIAEEMTKRL